MRVRLGIPEPTAQDVGYNQACWPEYARAVQQAGGEPVSVGLGLPRAEIVALLATLDGYVLPGSPADVDPAGYGFSRQAATASPDHAREGCDEQLMTDAATQGKPVLAVCFGLQRLNVLLGGTLVQDLLPLPVNHSAGPQVAVAHSVLVERESLFASLLSAAEAPADGPRYRRLAVNSSHHQAVASPGRGLSVVAWSTEDGVIEALEGRVGAATVLGVQWHPERSTDLSANSRALFRWLVAEAEDRRGAVTLDANQ